jgi:hypothetical protein
MIEKIEVNFTESRSNIYHVPLKQWRKWGISARQVFNEVYSSMNLGQRNFLHPKTKSLPRSQWKTTCWNAAWTAASAVERNGRMS